MIKTLLSGLLLFFYVAVNAQNKKPLTHAVYDGWKSVGERAISNNGRYVVYNIVPQEGDGLLVINNIDNGNNREIERGYGAQISQDSRYVFFKIKARYQDTRQARIKKKKSDEMPKDSLAMIALDTDSIIKFHLSNLLKPRKRVVVG